MEKSKGETMKRKEIMTERIKELRMKMDSVIQYSDEWLTAQKEYRELRKKVNSKEKPTI